MKTVAEIAKSAFDGVAASIGGVVKPAILSDGAATYSGRVVFGGETAPTGWPIAKAESKFRPAYLQGFSSVAQTGWEVTSGGNTYYICGVRDIADASGLQVANVISAGDMLWQTATFQRKTSTSDGAGSFTSAWAAIAGASDVPAGIVAMTGGERWASSRTEAQSDWRLICKPVTGLLESDRVVVNGQTYAIRFVNDVQARGLWQVLDLRLGAAS